MATSRKAEAGDKRIIGEFIAVWNEQLNCPDFAVKPAKPDAPVYVIKQNDCLLVTHHGQRVYKGYVRLSDLPRTTKDAYDAFRPGYDRNVPSGWFGGGRKAAVIVAPIRNDAASPKQKSEELALA